MIGETSKLALILTPKRVRKAAYLCNHLTKVTVVKAITLIDPAVRDRHDELRRHGSFEYIFEQSGS
jgi:hypothetical protein